MKPNDFFAFNGGNELSILPKCAILFHQAKVLSDNSYGGQDFVASLHDFFVDDNKHETVIGAGRLMSKEDVEAVLRSLLQMRQNKVNLMPSNIVSLSDNHIAWIVPATVRPMLFNISGMPMKKLSAPWPRLLMVANRNGKLAVAALKGRNRPSVKTKLFNAPLMNVSNNGAVCTGSATVPIECGIEDLNQWESVMFDTAFSHVNNPSTLNLDRKNKEVDTKVHYRFWQTLSKKGIVAFPTGQLVPMSRSLEEFILEHTR
ncbi:MAG: PRTRC system protein B [Methyloglobulus sp.]